MINFIRSKIDNFIENIRLENNINIYKQVIDNIYYHKILPGKELSLKEKVLLDNLDELSDLFEDLFVKEYK